jgi:hypothetical protein
VHDRFGRRKWAFWLLVGLVGAVLVVPSAVLLETLRSYYDFLTGEAPATIRPAQVRFLDRRNDSRAVPEQDLRFAEFRLRAPKAKAVDLVGDFNGWKPGTLLLSRSPGGLWEVMLPLPPGTYHYRFLVDGQVATDPEARAETGPDGKSVSVRAVK